MTELEFMNPDKVLTTMFDLSSGGVFLVNHFYYAIT